MTIRTLKLGETVPSGYLCLNSLGKWTKGTGVFTGHQVDSTLKGYIAQEVDDNYY